VKQAVNDFGDKFGDALDDLILKGEDLKDVLRGLVEELREILFQSFVREPVRRLADEIFGGILSLGGRLLFGGGSGGSGTGGGGGGGGTRSIRPPPKLFQHGGFLPARQPAIVGEAGPELFVPSRSGTVVPNAGTISGPTVYIDARGSNGDAAVEAAVQRGIARAAPFLINASVETIRDRRVRDPRLFGPSGS
jgi:hypothetical protein